MAPSAVASARSNAAPDVAYGSNDAVLYERGDNSFRQPAPEEPPARAWSGTVTFEVPVSPMQVAEDGAVTIKIPAEPVAVVERADDGAVVIRVPA